MKDNAIMNAKLNTKRKGRAPFWTGSKSDPESEIGTLYNLVNVEQTPPVMVWDDIARLLHNKHQTNRSAMACRTKYVRVFIEKFDADPHY